MSVQLDDLKRMAGNLLALFARDEFYKYLKSAEEAEMKIPIVGSPDEYISITYHPSSSHPLASTKSPKISYYKFKVGIPLEVVINSDEGYSRIILKTVSGVLRGFNGFDVDAYGNTAQDKLLPTTEILEIRKVLNRISSQSQ